MPPDMLHMDRKDADGCLKQHSINEKPFSFKLDEPLIPKTEEKRANTLTYQNFYSELAKGSYLNPTCRDYTTNDNPQEYLKRSNEENRTVCSKTIIIQKLSSNDLIDKLSEYKAPEYEPNRATSSLKQRNLINIQHDWQSPFKLANYAFTLEPFIYKPSNSITKYPVNSYNCINKVSAEFEELLLGDRLRRKSYSDFVHSLSTIRQMLGESSDITLTESKSITGQFLSTPRSNKSNNKIIYKNKSDILNRNFSSEDTENYSTSFKTDKYCNISNIYTRNDLTEHKKKLESLRKLYRLCPRDGFSLLKEMEFNDAEYVEWLKQNDFLKYTNYSKESTNSMLLPDNFLNYCLHNNSTSLKRKSLLSMEKYNFESKLNDEKFMDLRYCNVYELIIYEHVVIINFLTFFTSYFNVQRLRKLSMTDHILQIIFFALCYGIFVIVQN